MAALRLLKAFAIAALIVPSAQGVQVGEDYYYYTESRKDWLHENFGENLTAMRKQAQTPARQADKENMRKGTLYFLKNVKIKGDMSASDIISVASTVSAVKTLIDAANPEDIATAASDEGGLFSTVIEVCKDLLERLTKQLGKFAKKAADYVSKQLPEAVSKILGSMAPHLGAFAGIVGNLGKAAVTAIDVFKTRKLAKGIQSGQPKQVILSIRGQIKMFGLKTFGKAFLDSLMVGLKVANPGIGAVAGAVKTLLQFVMDTFFYFNELFSLHDIVADAKIQFDLKLYTNATAFQKWYTDIIKDMPIISSYCLAMPTSGHLYNFLSTVSADGEELSTNDIKEYHVTFLNVKEYAKKFVKAHRVVLYSDVPLLNASIKQARGE